MEEVAVGLKIAAWVIITVGAVAVIAFGAWALTRRQAKDNYQSPTVRPNRRVNGAPLLRRVK